MSYTTVQDEQGRTWRVDKRDVIRESEHPYTISGLRKGAKRVLVNDPNYVPTNRLVGTDQDWLLTQANADERLSNILGWAAVGIAGVMVLVALLLLLMLVF
jgi:hypothetical protein